MSKQEQYYEEADCIALYVVGEHAGIREKRIYAEAMRKLNINLTGAEEALWQSMLNSKTQMACIDGGLALLRPASQLRRKLFIMVAVLEASPHYTDHFLSRRFSFSYLVKIGLIGMRAICRGIAGIIILKCTKAV
jgi:hypothetical protein